MATTVNVTVLATDQNNDPVDGATVTAKLSHADVDSTYGYILPEEVSGTTNASGQVVLALWPNELGSTESYYVFKISNPDTGKVQRINATIPNANCNLHAVAESPTYSPGQVTTAPLNANLASIASLTTAADKVLYFSGANTAALANFTAAGRALVDDADAAAQRVTLGLGNVNNTSDADKQISTATQAALDAKQPLDAELTAIAGLTSAADRIPYFTGLGAAAVAVFTSAARTFTAAVDAAAQRVAIGLGNVDDTSDADKPVSTAQAAADAAVLSSAQSYADGLVVGLIDDRGNYDASVNTFPTSGGSGSAGAIKKGDLWTVSVAGTLGGHAVTAGDVIRALVDTPGQTDSNWAITENNFGYVAENSANKDASGGYAGLTLFKINFRNALNTITSFFTNANTAQRTYTFQDRDGTIADLEQFAASTGSSLVGHIASGTGAVATTVQAKLREWVSVKGKGAVGNGVANDRQAFLDADADGIAPIVLPSGTYRVSTPPAMENALLNLGASVTPDSGSWLPRFEHNIGLVYDYTKKVNTSAKYTSTPTTYTYLTDFGNYSARLINQAGYQQNFGSDSGGRTLVPVYYADVNHSGYGDVNLYHGAVQVSQHASAASVTKWVGQNSGTISSGAVNAGTSQVNLYGMEFHLSDVGHDDVTAMGLVLDFSRTGAKVESYSTPYIGVRLQDAAGGSTMDAGFQALGTWKVGLDFSGATFTAAKNAVSLKQNDRVYWGVAAIASSSDQWFAGDGGVSLGATYTDFDGTRLADTVDNVPILQRTGTEVSIKPGVNNDFSSRVYGASATAFGSIGQINTITYLTAASSGSDSTTLSLRVASSGTEFDSLVLNSLGDVKAFTGSIFVNTAGKGFCVKEGSNAKQGTAVLVGGTVTVSNTSVTANSRIFLTSNVDGGTPGFLRVSARSAGTSFTITSSSGTDTSTVAYQIFEPA